MGTLERLSFSTVLTPISKPVWDIVNKAIGFIETDEVYKSDSVMAQ